MKILIIEDEIKLGRFIKTGLEQANHVVEFINDGVKGLEEAMVNDYDLILLDLMLPGQNGFDILKNLKSFKKDTPVIIMSALNDTQHVIKGLDLGAMDYLKKPFDFDELMARIRVVQRKLVNINNSVLKVEDLELNLITREVYRNKERVYLSNREFSLLEFLMMNAGRVVTKTKIFEKVWEVNFDLGSNVIEVNMYQLRKKIDQKPNLQLIHTVIGRGYTLKGELQK